jgi:hypothetical protein
MPIGTSVSGLYLSRKLLGHYIGRYQAKNESKKLVVASIFGSVGAETEKLEQSIGLFRGSLDIFLTKYGKNKMMERTLFI